MPPAPALADVGTGRLLADGGQPMLDDCVAGATISFRNRCLDPDPRRLFRNLIVRAGGLFGVSLPVCHRFRAGCIDHRLHRNGMNFQLRTLVRLPVSYIGGTAPEGSQMPTAIIRRGSTPKPVGSRSYRTPMRHRAFNSPGTAAIRHLNCELESHGHENKG